MNMIGIRFPLEVFRQIQYDRGMKKVGQKPKAKVGIRWSGNFAYAIGLLASDGNLSSDGRHICFTTKDLQQAENFIQALGIKNTIGKKSSARSEEKKYFTVQFGDVLFYDFLVSIGITPAKSKTIGGVAIPGRYFFDFLRGVFDGDGYSYSYFDPRWKSSFVFYICFCSASSDFIEWIKSELSDRLGIKGHTTHTRRNSCIQLKYGKKEGVKIVAEFYKKRGAIFLPRKRLKIKKMLGIMDKLVNKH